MCPKLHSYLRENLGFQSQAFWLFTTLYCLLIVFFPLRERGENQSFEDITVLREKQ